MSQRFHSLSLLTGSSQSCNYPLAIEPYFGFSFFKKKPFQDTVDTVLLCSRDLRQSEYSKGKRPPEPAYTRLRARVDNSEHHQLPLGKLRTLSQECWV